MRFRTRKHLALLVRLALDPGRKLTRDYLTDLLWPEAPRRLAAHSLAQSLSVIRAHVGRAPVLVQRATVALQDGVVDVDVHHLDNGDVTVRGAFLEGFDLPAARPFEDWKDEWRAKLQPRVRDSLVKQMDAARRVGDFATVEQRAGVLHELDSLSEDAVRGLIEARAWVGDRSNALKAYAAYEARLAEELGAKPSPELQRMASLLRDGRQTRPCRPRGVSEPIGRMERRFEAETVIGREREFSVLYDAWLAARNRAPSIVVLTGDAGLGKTTLTNAFLSTCQLEGAVVARAQAYEGERELPFGVLAELMRQLVLQRAVGGAEPEALSELSRLTPEVRAHYPGVPQPVEWAAEIVPLRLANAFLKTVTAAAEESPLVLVVDDLHATDNASAAILHLVARKLPATRLLLILAARSTELRRSGAPAALTSDTAIDALRPLELEPLPDEAAELLVERVSDAAAGPTDGGLPRERILRAGRGNPLALELLTREWVIHGPESLLRDLEALNTQPAVALGIPRAIKAVFERQLARLDQKTRAVLDLAAVLGRRLADLSLYQAVDSSPVEAAEALARLRDEGFVREVHGDIEFRNELIRAQAYYGIPAAGRQHLHKSVADRLDRDSTQLHGPFVEIAWHYLRAGQHALALQAGITGATTALNIGAPAEAEQLVSGLLVHPADAATTTRLHRLLSRALLDQSKADHAMPYLESLSRDLALSARERADVTLMRASAEYLRSRDWNQHHLEAADVALRAAYATGDPELVVPALFENALAGYEMGDEERVRFVSRQIEDLLKDGRVAPLASAHFTRGFCHQFFFDARLAAECFDTAVVLLNRTTDAPKLAGYLTGRGFAAFYLCDLDTAHKAFSDALEIARRLGDESRASRVCANLCTLEGVRGNYNAALAFGDLGVRCGTSSPNQPFLFMAYVNQIDSLLLIGRTDRAQACLEQARRWVGEHRSWNNEASFLCEEASLGLALGDTGLAIRTLQKLERLAGGRERAVPEMGAFIRLKVFKAGHERQFELAFQWIAEARARFRDRCPMMYLDVLAASAWLEKRCSGSSSAGTEQELLQFKDRGVSGRLALLKVQGFLDS